MTPQDLINFFGSMSAVARALGCKPQTVSEWVAAGKVPEGRQYQAEIATTGKLCAEKPALRIPFEHHEAA